MYMTIKEVSEKTGVNPVTLRAWERRYGLITPKRSEKGYRHYSLADLVKIQTIVDWLKQGLALPRIKELLNNQTQKVANLESAVTPEWIPLFWQQLSDGRYRQAQHTFNNNLLECPVDLWWSHCIKPIEMRFTASEHPYQKYRQQLWYQWIQQASQRLIQRNQKSLREEAWFIGFHPMPIAFQWLFMAKLQHQGIYLYPILEWSQNSLPMNFLNTLPKLPIWLCLDHPLNPQLKTQIQTSATKFNLLPWLLEYNSTFRSTNQGVNHEPSQ